MPASTLTPRDHAMRDAIMMACGLMLAAFPGLLIAALPLLHY